MSDTFSLPVEYLGSNYELPLTIVPIGYSYQIQIVLDGQELKFEKDEEGKYRVINASDSGKTNTGLIQAIITTLESLV
ncbi:hypothetical protein SAMN04487996_1163 [Dyadobacter soli]|uniref:Uncharacterized protein n=1 Tax=Dyadobacter soli TaxID=659014 RepID=A0A1G7S673_9BACT|nr:hypothetical protein SAMN04487996_1163 [Dyadobacter soli]